MERRAGIVTYGLTPPKEDNTPEKIAEIANKLIDRMRNTEIDGLIIYDIQDEANRNEQERPFPFLKTIDPTVYGHQYLAQLDVPKIVYRCVGKYTEDELAEWIASDPGQDRFSVFVGPSSSQQEIRLSLTDAYELSRRANEKLILGGVVIPERHLRKNDEHLRVVQKMTSGCRFFVSQAIYNVEASKNFLSDYYYYCQNHQIEMVPILFNLTPCGSLKTLEFMKWLGISIPKWLENDLMNSNDILDKSVNLTKKIFEELLEFGLEKGIPVGCSVESVSTRKVEIDASVQLLNDVRAMIDRKLMVAR
nr:methylenetetrahydrofolate reductase [Paenibacillus hamazuiensis]